MSKDTTPPLSDLELLKLSFEWCKHVATLSTGSILLIVTFLDKLAEQPGMKFLLPIALLSFVLAILGTLGVQLDHLLRGKYVGASIAGSISAVFALAGFLTGIVALTVFGIVNLH